MDKPKNSHGSGEGKQSSSASAARADGDPTAALDRSNNPTSLDVLEVRQLIIRDPTGTPRIIFGINSTNEACIEVKSPDGVTKIEINVDNESRATIGLQNGRGEYLHMWGYDDELGLELTGKQGFPRFGVHANDDAGIIAAFSSQAQEGKDPEGVGIVLGMDANDRPVIQIGD